MLVLAANAAGAADLDSLLRSLAREPPQSIAFIETHASPLLEGELVVSGELEYRGDGKLSRVVNAPYHERIDIDGTDVRIQREGRPERRFSLRRSAELGGILSAFSALLSGDRAVLESSFEPTVEFRPDGWELDLAPRQADHIGRIRVWGKGDAPSCIAVLASDGSMATMIQLGMDAPGQTPACNELRRATP